MQAFHSVGGGKVCDSAWLTKSYLVTETRLRGVRILILPEDAEICLLLLNLYFVVVVVVYEI